MNVIEKKHVFSDDRRIYFLRVEVEDLGEVLEEIFQALSDLSWISQFDEEYIRMGFQQRVKDTLKSITEKIETHQTDKDKVSADAGEYIVSELAREAIIHELCYLDIPLAELYGKKVSGNPGFDFHSQTQDEIIVFGEAKYSTDRNAYGIGLKQVVRFIAEGKDISDAIDLRDFCSEKALKNVTCGIKGFSIAFSAKEIPSEKLIEHITRNKDFVQLLCYNEIILVAVNI